MYYFDLRCQLHYGFSRPGINLAVYRRAGSHDTKDTCEFSWQKLSEFAVLVRVGGRVLEDLVEGNKQEAKIRLSLVYHVISSIPKSPMIYKVNVFSRMTHPVGQLVKGTGGWTMKYEVACLKRTSRPSISSWKLTLLQVILKLQENTFKGTVSQD